MKKAILLTTILFTVNVFLTSFILPKKITGEKILKKMYKRYSGNWYKNFTFTQTTENYRKDSLVKTSTRYEAIVFPDYFRITIGDSKDGNAMIFNKDSSYNFSKGKLVRKGPKDEDLTFLLGGMYFLPFDSVKVKMNKEGYNIDKAYESKWQGKDVYVIGAENDEEKSSQVWIEKERLIVTRFIRYKGATKEEAIFGGHQQFGKAWTETTVSFYINDKLLQKEKYFDCKVNTAIDMKQFDPYNFVK